MKLEKIIKGITVNEIIGDASQEISGIKHGLAPDRARSYFRAVKGRRLTDTLISKKAIEKGSPYSGM